MKIIFLGTPEFAVPSLKAIIAAGHEVAAVVTQPDREAGRGQKIVFSPVKKFALSHGLKVLQYPKIRLSGATELRELNVDIMVTMAYGQILSREILEICPYGVINVHASLLPKYRGSSPINWAIINGEKVTGITIMQTAEGLDTGDILLSRQVEIGENETAGELTARLSEVGAAALIDTLELIASGRAVKTPQDESQASYFPMLDKKNIKIDWQKSAADIVNLVRGLNPSPTAYFTLDSAAYKVWSCRAVLEDVISTEVSQTRSGEISTLSLRGAVGDEAISKFPSKIEGCRACEAGNVTNSNPGTILFADPKKGLIIQCGAGTIEILEFTPPAKNRMPAKAFLAGMRTDLEGTELI